MTLPTNPYFDIKKYTDYQLELKEKVDSGEISSASYFKKSGLLRERQQLLKKIERIYKWMEKHNLPFTIDVLFSNIQLELDFRKEMRERGLDLPLAQD